MPATARGRSGVKRKADDAATQRREHEYHRGSETCIAEAIPDSAAARSSEREVLEVDDGVVDDDDGSDTLGVGCLTNCVMMNATDFENWQSFEKELQDYLEETFQHFVVSNNTPISYRNKKIAAQHPNDPSRLLPETLVSYVRTYKCTHGGQPRKRGTGARPQQHARQIGCPAKLNVGVKQVGDDTWIVRVTQHVREHNHNVSESVYNRYPHVRQRMSTETQRHVQALISAKTPYRIILDMLRSGGNEHIRMKDLHNIAQKVRQESSGSSTAEQQPQVATREVDDGHCAHGVHARQPLNTSRPSETPVTHDVNNSAHRCSPNDTTARPDPLTKKARYSQILQCGEEIAKIACTLPTPEYEAVFQCLLDFLSVVRRGGVPVIQAMNRPLSVVAHPVVVRERTSHQDPRGSSTASARRSGREALDTTDTCDDSNSNLNNPDTRELPASSSAASDGTSHARTTGWTIPTIVSSRFHGRR